MTLGIDLVGTSLESGTKSYNLNFCENLNNENFSEKIIIFLTKDYYKNLEKKNNKKITYKIKPNFLSISFFRILWMQLILPIEIKINKIDKFFSPMNFGPIFICLLNVRLFLGLHSNLPWIFLNKMPGPYVKNFLIKLLTQFSIKICEKLIVNSYYAKKEIVDLLKLKDKNVFPVYLGIDKKYLFINKNFEKSLENFDYEDYFVSVLSCVRYHNIINLLKSFKLFKKENNGKLKFVLVLQVLDKNYFREIKNYINDNFENDEVIILMNLNIVYLKKLYKKANFYIFSSYSEVFGLTSLEAMSQKCPVLISKNSALPEINANAAMYFDPDDVTDIKNKMNEIANNKELRLNLIELGLKNIDKFDWKKNIRETMKVLEI